MKKLDRRDYSTKSINQQLLPSRHTLNDISKADPMQRTLGNYAKATPNITQSGPSILGVDEST